MVNQSSGKAVISVTDRSKFVAYFPNIEIPLKLQIGDKIQKNDPYMGAIKSGKITGGVNWSYEKY